MRPSTNDRLRWTVEKRRKAEAARLAKRRDDHSDLITRLKILFDLRTPESWRESLAADMPSLTARCLPGEARRWMPTRAVDWIIKTFWERLPEERNPMVRYSLLRLGARLLTRPPFTYNEGTRDGRATSAMLNVLEQDLYASERERALGLMNEILSWSWGAVNEECSVRIVRMSLRMIEHHCTMAMYSVRTMRRLVICMRFGVQEMSSLAIIIDNEHALPYIFDGIRFAVGKLHVALSALFSVILECTESSDRATLVIRHYTQLKQAFHLMQLRDMVYFLMHPEFAAIVSTTPSLLELIYRHQRHDCRVHEDDCWTKFAYDDYGEIATYVMESALNDRSRLEEILGYGFLMVAGHFATNRYDFHARRVTTFRQILSKHPEWKQKFKEITIHGADGNMTADLGRTIPDKPASRGVLYSLVDEDAQL